MSHVEIGKTYRHFKGTYHQVLNVALDSETQERMVVYNHKEDGKIWVRPEKMFLEEIPADRVDNVTGQKHRFELVEEIEKNYLK